MARNRSDSHGSLDLLLDAICNTFGGILFLAMLVAVLLSTSGKQEDATSEKSTLAPDEWLQMQAELETAQTSLAGLLTAISQQASLQQEFDEPDLAATVARLQAVEKQNAELEAERVRRLGEVVRKKAQTAEVLAELADLDARLASVTQEVEHATLKWQSEVRARTQSASLPRVRQSGKRPIGIIVRYGRYYVLHEYDQFGFRNGLNRNDFFIVEDGVLAVQATPKPYGGVAVSDQDGLSAALKHRDDATQFLDIAIWEDSFSEFQLLKTAMVNFGFEYRLTLVRNGGGIVDQGASDSSVQ